MNFPEIVDIALPVEGVFHKLVFVSIPKNLSDNATLQQKRPGGATSCPGG
jgi:3-polyprenyl-4-hydroxybenzoate decarboxylase